MRSPLATSCLHTQCYAAEAVKIEPESADVTEILLAAVEQGVAFVPGSIFYPNGGGANTMRLNFSNASPERIVGGLRDSVRCWGSTETEAAGVVALWLGFVARMKERYNVNDQ